MHDNKMLMILQVDQDTDMIMHTGQVSDNHNTGSCVPFNSSDNTHASQV